MDMSLSKLRETGKAREDWRAAVCGVAVSRTRLSERNSNMNMYVGVCVSVCVCIGLPQ